MGKDTHALSGPAQNTALEVLAANGVETIIQPDDGVTPTPVISRAIIVYNRGRTQHLADGIVITPSHNPPEDGGFKYNPPQRRPGRHRCHLLDPGPRPNDLLKSNNAEVKRMPLAAALKATTTHEQDYRSRVCRGFAKRRRYGRDPLGRAQARRRSARRRGGALLGADQSSYTAWISRW